MLPQSGVRFVEQVFPQLASARRFVKKVSYVLSPKGDSAASVAAFVPAFPAAAASAAASVPSSVTASAAVSAAASAAPSRGIEGSYPHS